MKIKMNTSASPTLITQTRINLSFEDALLSRKYHGYTVWPYPITIRDRDNLILRLPYLDSEMEELARSIQICGSITTFKFYLSRKESQSTIRLLIELSNNTIVEALKNFI